MTPINTEIQVKNLDHLGLVAGIVDELGIVEIINEQVGIQPGEIVNAGLVVKPKKIGKKVKKKTARSEPVTCPSCSVKIRECCGGQSHCESRE